MAGLATRRHDYGDTIHSRVNHWAGVDSGNDEQHRRSMGNMDTDHYGYRRDNYYRNDNSGQICKNSTTCIC